MAANQMTVLRNDAIHDMCSIPNISRRGFLRSASALAMGAALGKLGSPACGQGKNMNRPNILLINIDDLGWKDVGFMGRDIYHTPNLDRLASQGMIFTNSYAASANCAPSRASMFTGQFTPRHGIYTVGRSDRGPSRERKLVPVVNRETLPEKAVTFASVLRSHGYTTATIGKWHLGKDPSAHGFDLNIAGDHRGSPDPGGYFAPYKGLKGLQKAPDGEYLTDRLNDEAIRFLEENRKGPFLLNLAHFAVHKPLMARGEDLETNRHLQGEQAIYAAMIENLDRGLGRLIGALDELGLSEKTAVIFTSDNGGIASLSSQAPLRSGKGSFYEGGIRVPMVVRWPGTVRGGTTTDVPNINIDLFPTFLEMAGAAQPTTQPLDGMSLMPLLRQTGNLPDRPLFWHFPIYLQAYDRDKDDARDPLFRTRPGSAMRHGKWKLHEYFEDGGVELYNLETDLGERVNLADQFPDEQNQLHERLKQWRADVQAPVPTEMNPAYQPESNVKA